MHFKNFPQQKYNMQLACNANIDQCRIHPYWLSHIFVVKVLNGHLDVNYNALDFFQFFQIYIFSISSKVTESSLFSQRYIFPFLRDVNQNDLDLDVNVEYTRDRRHEGQGHRELNLFGSLLWPRPTKKICFHL